MFEHSRKIQFYVLAVAFLGLTAVQGCKQTKPDEEPTASEASEGSEKADEVKKKAEGETEDSSRVEEKGGDFSAPVPKNWTAEAKKGRIDFKSPDGNVAMYLLSVETKDLKKAIEQGWKEVGLERELKVKNEQTPPSGEGFEKTLVLNYELSEEQRVGQAVARLRKGTVYLTLIDGDLAPIQKRASQLQIIASGYEVAGVEKTDLSEKKAKKFDEAKQKKLGAFAQKQMKLFGYPGMSVAVVQDGEVVWKDGFGVRKKGGSEKVTPKTLMMIGSVTKSMTTMLMAKAVDDGKMEWETRAKEILPRFKVKDPKLTDKITMQHLVCACTGVPRRDFEMLFRSEEMTAEKTIESIQDFETFTDFGEAFQYSNQMVAVGGYVTAKAYGGEWGNLHEKYVSLMDDRVFGPIGMESTLINFEDAIEVENRAEPHELSFEGEYEPADLAVERFAMPVAPAGAVWSTAEDMAHYALTQIGKGKTPSGKRVVSVENLTKTWEPQIKVDENASYGLGWINWDYKGKEVIVHGGGTLGFSSYVTLVPEDELGIVILSNGIGTHPGIKAIRDRLFELVYDVPEEAAKEAKFAKKERDKSFAKTKEKLADKKLNEAGKRFAGKYRNDAVGTLELEVEGGQLVADVGEFSWTLHRMKPEKQKAEEAVDVYMATEPPRLITTLELHEDDSGERFVRIGKGTTQYDFERVE